MLRTGQKKPLITVVSSIRNAEDTVASTVQSVLSQTYDNIEYILVDGGSTDGTLRAIEPYRDRITEVISELDEGLYDGLAKAFLRAHGDIYCYLNAGDCFFPYALSVVADIFQNPDIVWLTGCRAVANERDVITSIDLPFRYRSSLIRRGSYGLILPYIQQESTFWRASLMRTVDMSRWRKLRLAGDYYLWWSFAAEAELTVVSSPLGIFKKHYGQISEDSRAYHAEIDGFVSRRNGLGLRLAEAIELAGWALHPRVRARLVRTVLRYDHKTGQWQWRFV